MCYITLLNARPLISLRESVLSRHLQIWRAFWNTPYGCSHSCVQGRGLPRTAQVRLYPRNKIRRIWNLKIPKFLISLYYFRKYMCSMHTASNASQSRGPFQGYKGWPVQWSISCFCLLLHGISNLFSRWRTSWSECERPWSESSACCEQPSQGEGQADWQSQKVRSWQHCHGVHIHVSLPA